MSLRIESIINHIHVHQQQHHNIEPMITKKPAMPLLIALILLLALTTYTTCQPVEVSTQTMKQILKQLQQPQEPTKYPPINFTALNHKLETLNPQYLHDFAQAFSYDRILNLNDHEAGHYLFLLGKMYLYDMLPPPGEGDPRLLYNSQGRYLLAYFYLQVSAEIYENGDAYYYLALLQYIKLTPTTLVKARIKELLKLAKTQDRNKKSHGNDEQLGKILRHWQQLPTMDHQQLLQFLEQTIYDMQSHHLHYTEHNLYLASVLGQLPAKLSLAYMFKQGISTEKNCSAAIGYYLSAIKATKIDTFEYPSDYIDRRSFERELYARKKLDLKGYGEYDPSVLMHTSMFDDETHSAYEDVAMKYMTGEDGFPVNETLSAQMFEKVVSTSRLARVMLGFMYLKGRGVNKNYARARHLFQLDEKISKVAKETLLVMKFYNLGFTGKKDAALQQMKRLYSEYEKRINITKPTKQAIPRKKGEASTAKTPTQQQGQIQQQQQKGEEQNQQTQAKSVLKSLRQRKQALRTPMIKYLIGSLVISDDIKGDKRYAINLIDEAAKQGNTLALTQLGLIFIDGSDVSYDCQKSANYFSKQSLSHPTVQQRIELAKLAIKHEKYTFAFVKYVQLMMVGYPNAFVNALYMLEVYGQQVFGFGEHSWSVGEARKNQVYRMLVKEEIVHKVDEHLFKGLGLDQEGVFALQNIDYLTHAPSPSSSSTTTPSNPPQLQEHISYMALKITSIGILKHDISILKFHKFKQTQDINVLHQLANLGENSPHVYESRFLLGRYYHHTVIKGTKEEVRWRRALEEYNRATKNKLLASLIYFLEGGDWSGSDRIVSHFFTYLTAIIVVGILLYRQRSKKIEEIIMMEHRKEQEMMNEKMAEGEAQEGRMREQDAVRMGQKQDRSGMADKQYNRPKFSEEQAEHMVNHRNLMNIGFMMEQLKNKRKQQQSPRNNHQDPDQPVIIDDENKVDPQGDKLHYG